MAQPGTRLQTADRIGFAASMLCAVHCAALPVLLALLPTLGLGSQGWVDIDQGVVVFATVLAATTLTIGWRRHRAYHAWGLLLPALLLLWFGAFGPFHAHGHAQPYAWLHWGLMVPGGVLLALAHLTNMRLTHRAGVLAVTKNQG
ncbi:MAG: MerC domain-containing protein [Pseudomonadota bacterium]|nr:MerC domain-containing protein [Pseudomonadota bacterium]